MSQLIVEVNKIDEILEHPNADRLEVAVVKGWNCIIQKGQYKAGDLIVYIPPDSVMPDDLIEKYKLEYLRNGGRVRTVKLRGYVSQGLILPLPSADLGKYKVGMDMSKSMGITKWEPPAPKYQVNQPRTSKKRTNQNFDKYSSPDNIKHYPNVFEDGDLVVVTEKIHGTNWRAGTLPKEEKGVFAKIKKKVLQLIGKYNPYEFVYGSHNVQISGNSTYKGFYGEDVYGRVAKKYNMKDIIPPDYIVFGEAYGEGIQDLTYGVPSGEIHLVVFDVKYKSQYLSYPAFEAFCEQRNLPMAPVLHTGKWNQKTLPYFTDGKSIICPTQIREGCVVKGFYEENHPQVGRKMLKSISADYLTRDDATEYH